MIYCINPECKQRQNSDDSERCQACGTPLLINNQYRLIQPLRRLDPRTYTDIFEVDDKGTRKVIKVLKDNNPRLVQLMEREANVLQWLNHPGIPKVELDGYFNVTPRNSTQELHCLVMEKIEGQNLEQWVKKYGRISQKRALNWLRQLIEILEQIHKNGILHRDIKPSNIMLKSDEQLVLVDFGSVREMTDTYLAKIGGGLEVTGIVSAGYTPLEQLNGKVVPQSDFYALGRTFVHLLTGVSPVELPTNSEGQLIWQDKAPQVSKPLADFLDELMALSPEDRPQSANLILSYLTIKGLWIKSALRLLTSSKFQFRVAASLTLGLASLVIYRSSFPLIAQQYYERGIEAQKAQQLEIARSYYEEALAFNPKDARIYNNLGLLCQSQKDYTCAKIKYEQALNLNPYNPVARYNLGGLYDDSGDFERAEAQYQLAMQSDSDVAANASSDLARLKILDGDTTTAIELSLKGLQQTDKPKVQAALYKNLGWARWMQADYDSAEADLRKAIDLNSQRTDAYCLLAQVLEVKGDNSTAIEAWENCLRYDSKNRVEVKVWKTMAIQRLKGAGEKK